MYLDDFLVTFRDATIYNLMQTEEGNEYLEKCWNLEQTTPDRERLKNKFNK